MSMKQRLDFFRSVSDSANGGNALKRIKALVDVGSFTEIDALAKFDGNLVGAVAGVAKISGKNVCVFAMDSSVNSGAFNPDQAEKLLKIFELAKTTGVPVVGIYDSKGASLKDESGLLKALSKLLAETNKISGVVPQISIVLGSCFGIGALLATSADFTIASEDAMLNIVAGDDQTDIKTVEKNGSVAVLASSEEEAIAKAKSLIEFLPSNNLSKADLYRAVAPSVASLDAVSAEIYEQKDKVSYDKILSSFADAGSVFELQPNFGTAGTIAFARLNGKTVGTVVFKGDTLDEDTCTKVARFVRFCDAFSIPVITFTDAKEFNSLRDASKLANAYCDATTAKISIITGKAFGSVFAATSMQNSSSDFTIAWMSASVSAMNPVAAAIFYDGDKLKDSSNPVEDRKKLIKSYIQDKATPFEMADKGLLQSIIRPSDTRKEVSAILELLETKRVSKLAKKHSNINL